MYLATLAPLFGESTSRVEQTAAINRALGPIPDSLTSVIDREMKVELFADNAGGLVDVETLCAQDTEVAQRVLSTRPFGRVSPLVYPWFAPRVEMYALTLNVCLKQIKLQYHLRLLLRRMLSICPKQRMTMEGVCASRYLHPAATIQEAATMPNTRYHPYSRSNSQRVS